MQTRYQLRHSPATQQDALQSRPARWNAVSIQAPQPCVVLDRHDAATTPPRRRDTAAATAQRRHSDATVLPARRFPMIAGRPPTSINPPSAVTLLPDPHLAAPAGKPRAHGRADVPRPPADRSQVFNV